MGYGRCLGSARSVAHAAPGARARSLSSEVTVAVALGMGGPGLSGTAGAQNAARVGPLQVQRILAVPRVGSNLLASALTPLASQTGTVVSLIAALLCGHDE